MEIIWTDLAIQQLDEIAEYVQDNFGESISRKMVRKISEQVNRLKQQPSIGKPDFEYFSNNNYSDIQIRHLQIFPNLVYYLEQPERIDIICIMHCKQSPSIVANMIKDFLLKAGTQEHVD